MRGKFGVVTAVADRDCPRSGLDHHIRLVDRHLEPLGHVRALGHATAGLDVAGITPDPSAFGVAPGLAGSEFEVVVGGDLEYGGRA